MFVQFVLRTDLHPECDLLRLMSVKFPKFSGRGFWLYETDSLSQRMLVEDLPSSEPVVGSITLASNR